VPTRPLPRRRSAHYWGHDNSISRSLDKSYTIKKLTNQHLGCAFPCFETRLPREFVKEGNLKTWISPAGSSHVISQIHPIVRSRPTIRSASVLSIPTVNKGRALAYVTLLRIQNPNSNLPAANPICPSETKQKYSHV